MSRRPKHDCKAIPAPDGSSGGCVVCFCWQEGHDWDTDEPICLRCGEPREPDDLGPHELDPMDWDEDERWERKQEKNA